MVNLNQADDYMAAAQKDVALVEHLLPDIREFPEAICFHCEQAAEKMLKQMWVENGVLPRHTHNLSDLLGMATERGWVQASKRDIYAAEFLAAYGTKLRYVILQESEYGEAVEAVLECNQISDMLRRNGYEYFPIRTSSHFLRDEGDASLDFGDQNVCGPSDEVSGDVDQTHPRPRR